ncbi:flagellar FliJ family protein [Oscillospiraceae bacterium OttesenSCG-928-G22]|nr:flagellar FliJ family protein [Oscillospiraceae bacterium OttesenSCG-928-G22]
MKRFRFTLQSLLNIKVALEKQQKAELAEVEARLRVLVAELTRILDRHASLREEYKSLSGELTSADFQFYLTGFQALRDRERLQRVRVTACEKEKAEVQARLIETMTERKTVEKLKEKKYAEYLEECRKEDDLIINEYVSNKVAVGGDSDG